MIPQAALTLKTAVKIENDSLRGMNDIQKRNQRCPFLWKVSL
jgi:hypothetical protein